MHSPDIPPEPNLDSEASSHRYTAGTLALLGRKPHWALLVLGHLYFWPKLVDYLGLFMVVSDVIEALRLSLNIPVYTSFLLYLLQIEIRPRIFWKIWILVAILDEVLMGFELERMGYNPEIEFYLLMLPLYVVGLIYAYGSNQIWSKDNSAP